MSSPLQNTGRVASSAPVPQRPIFLEKILDAALAPKANEVATGPPDAQEIVDYIVKEMVANTSSQSPDFIRVKDLFREFRESTGAPALRVTALIRSLYEFINLVGYERKWDQKSFIRGTWGKVSLLFGAQIDYDIWSNIHYGFVGRQIGFNPEVLLTAAGYAQAANSIKRATFSGISRKWFERWLNGQVTYLGQALDDPADQAAITMGMQLSDTRSREVRPADVTALLKKFLPQVSRR